MAERPTRGENVNEVIATLRGDYVALQGRVTRVESDIGGLRGDLEAKHKENRSSIHDLRNGQQNVVDVIHRLDMKLENQFHELDKKFAKASGYMLGAGAVLSVLWKILDHLWK